MRGAVAAVLLVVLAAGCQRKAATGPAWPAPAVTDVDGGESLAPRQPAVATALEKAAEPEKTKQEAPAAAPTTPTVVESPEPEVPETTGEASDDSGDEVIIHEEIIIEIDEDDE